MARLSRTCPAPPVPKSPPGFSATRPRSRNTAAGSGPSGRERPAVQPGQVGGLRRPVADVRQMRRRAGPPAAAGSRRARPAARPASRRRARKAAVWAMHAQVARAVADLLRHPAPRSLGRLRAGDDQRGLAARPGSTPWRPTSARSRSPRRARSGTARTSRPAGPAARGSRRRPPARRSCAASAATAASSSAVCTVPVGLCGLHSSSTAGATAGGASANAASSVPRSSRPSAPSGASTIRRSSVLDERVERRVDRRVDHHRVAGPGDQPQHLDDAEHHVRHQRGPLDRYARPSPSGRRRTRPAPRRTPCPIG